MKYEIKKINCNTYNIIINNVDRSQLLKLMSELINIEADEETQSSNKEDLSWFYDRAKEMGRDDIKYIALDKNGTVYGYTDMPSLCRTGWYGPGSVRLGYCSNTEKWMGSLYLCPDWAD